MVQIIEGCFRTYSSGSAIATAPSRHDSEYQRLHRSSLCLSLTSGYRDRRSQQAHYCRKGSLWPGECEGLRRDLVLFTSLRRFPSCFIRE
ncbi:hypothetical protein KC19_6G015600 [Ceratodon purpureus]|uniref:Uncharacterized protein n=1 Tax=Ceratodon purpureus TaxID=3225 RepID=A0A8T0H8W7_CERPU|nr:hypothetical protein KC19_6G015600 [Ceratodon purpureus]